LQPASIDLAEHAAPFPLAGCAGSRGSRELNRFHIELARSDVEGIARAEPFFARIRGLRCGPKGDLGRVAQRIQDAEHEVGRDARVLRFKKTVTRVRKVRASAANCA
jgi:hypothetical protein